MKKVAASARNRTAGEKFQRADQPAVPVNEADRQEYLEDERDPEQRDYPTRDRARRNAVERPGDEDDEHDSGVEEGMNVKRVNQVVDVENTAPDVENFQHQREERNTAEHHVRQIAEECADEEAHLCSVFAHFFLGARFQPALERGLRFLVVVKDKERAVANGAIVSLA